MELTDAYSVLSFVYRSLFANYTVLQETVKLEIISRIKWKLACCHFLKHYQSTRNLQGFYQ